MSFLYKILFNKEFKLYELLKLKKTLEKLFLNSELKINNKKLKFKIRFFFITQNISTLFKSNVLSFAVEARKQYESVPENRGKLKSPDYFLNIGLTKYINTTELMSEKTKEDLNLREKEQINREFMNSEIQVGENKVTPLQIQKAFLSGKYSQEQKENLYMQIVKQFENILHIIIIVKNKNNIIGGQINNDKK